VIPPAGFFHERRGKPRPRQRLERRRAKRVFDFTCGSAGSVRRRAVKTALHRRHGGKRGESIMAKPIITLLAAFAFAGFGALGAARAEDLECRAVVHVTSAQSQDVGDIDGHVLSLVRASGIASFQDGSTAATYLVAQTDYIKGAGTATSYNNLTFDDGSVLWYKAAGTATVDGNRTIFKGMITVIGGKGRFAGAKGEGGLNGARLGTGPDLFLDQMISVRK
jgi:hypothetical protein